jgi:hypothetical protein
MTNGQNGSKEERSPDARRLARNLDSFAAGLPGGAGAVLRWLNRGSSRWIRIPIGVLLIVGGIFGFLPILGFWMLPLGGLLLALDIAVLRKPMLWLVANGKWQWRKMRRLKRNGLARAGDTTAGQGNGGGGSPVERRDIKRPDARRQDA